MMDDLAERLRSLSFVCSNDSISLCSTEMSTKQKTTFENGSPVITPLNTIDEVLSWQVGCDDFCVSSVPFRIYSEHDTMANPLSQKVMVCHDMMGGYINDKFVQGSSCLEDYYFYHWQYIDAFIYFSHHLITLPPPTWTNVAHRHGVLSLGTVITEGKPGVNLCHSLFSNKFKVTRFAEQLVSLSKYYKFDGWLVNIENPIHPTLMEQLHLFLSLLTSGMHGAVPRSKVIWYDSVTKNGDLVWQNQLNLLNKPFFDMCDGIFLNYNWDEEKLAHSRAQASNRYGDVYVGVDVFGRGCYGGGGYNTFKAMEVISKHSLSSAIFAPGWVFETQSKADFFHNQDRFWSLLSKFRDSLKVCGLPLVSSFGRGFGDKVTIDGKIVYEGQWCNHSCQDLQPSFAPNIFKNDLKSAIQLQHVSVDGSKAYYNGACLKLEGVVQYANAMSRPAIARLFKTEITIVSPLLVGFTRHIDCSDQPSVSQLYKCFLQLHTTGSPSRVFLDLSSDVADHGDEAVLNYGLPRSRDVPSLPGCVLAPLSSRSTAALLEVFTGGSDWNVPWETRFFVIDKDELIGLQITQVDIGFYVIPTQTDIPKEFSLTIGEIKIMDTTCLSPSFDFSRITNVWQDNSEYSHDDNTVSLTLLWSVFNNPLDPIDHCNIFTSTKIDELGHQPWQTQFVFMGKAYGTCFRIKDLFIASLDLGKTSLSLEFRVQPVTLSRWKLAVPDSPVLVVKILS